MNEHVEFQDNMLNIITDLSLTYFPPNYSTKMGVMTWTPHWH